MNFKGSLRGKKTFPMNHFAKKMKNVDNASMKKKHSKSTSVIRKHYVSCEVPKRKKKCNKFPHAQLFPSICLTNNNNNKINGEKFLTFSYKSMNLEQQQRRDFQRRRRK